MKRLGVVSIVFPLFALLGVTALAYMPQEQPRDKQGKQQQDQNKQQRRTEQPRQDQNRQQQRGEQPRQDQNNQQPRRAEQPRRDEKQQQQQRAKQLRRDEDREQRLQRTQQQQRADRREQQRVWQQHRARRWEAEHRTWLQRGGYDGYRIPVDYFRSSFGRDHWFRVYSLPFMVVGGHPCFQYRGQWFVFVDPYPEYWGDTWYQTDEVYVDFVNDGYYLYNRRYPDHPGVAISISFSLPVD